MIFHENRLLADDSYEISYLIGFFFQKLGNMSQNLLSVAVVIDTLRVKITLYERQCNIIVPHPC